MKFSNKTIKIPTTTGATTTKKAIMLQLKNWKLRWVKWQLHQQAKLSIIETNPKEHVQTITTRNGVRLLEIPVKRLVVSTKKIPTMCEEHVDQPKKITEKFHKAIADSPKVKATVPVKVYVPLVPFPQRLKT